MLFTTVFNTLLTSSIVLASPTLIIIKANGADLNSQATGASPQAGTPCSPQVMALASGIEANIADQNNEVATVTALGNVLSQNPVDTALYSATQVSLLNFVMKGIAIRENNQKITPAGNAATAGLATVAMAQMTELSLTQGLALAGNGTVDVAKANTTVTSLKGDFSGGIQQNKKNLAAAMGNCTAPAKATAPAAKRLIRN